MDGKVQNCQTYIASTGECANCKPGFEFDEKLNCRLSTVICPQNTETKKYFVQGLRCVETDVGCKVPNQDGSCPVCQEGFYSQSGRCIKVGGLSESSAGLDLSEREIFADDFGNSFCIGSGDQRVHLMGPNRNLQQ